MTESSQHDETQTESATFLADAQSLAEEAAREAGAYLLAKQGQARVARLKAARDEQLDADLEAERIILERLRASFPTHSILSEEAGLLKGDSPYRWVVDPLDGSANYQHGSPLYGVMLALQHRRRTVLGVIYLPPFDELFVAQKDGAATLNGAAIQVSEMHELHRAVAHVGDFAKSGKREDNTDRLAIFTQVVERVGRVRMAGSAAVDFAWVACGRADGLVMFGAHPWDRVAGELIVRQAHGRADEIASA